MCACAFMHVPVYFCMCVRVCMHACCTPDPSSTPLLALSSISWAFKLSISSLPHCHTVCLSISGISTLQCCHRSLKYRFQMLYGICFKITQSCSERCSKNCLCRYTLYTLHNALHNNVYAMLLPALENVLAYAANSLHQLLQII